MSAKYQRIKQSDLALPAPLRWLTRAFSSITMAVVLLVLVVVYGIVASVPVMLLALGGIYALVLLATVGVACLASFFMLRSQVTPLRVLISLLTLAVASYLAYLGCRGAYDWAMHQPTLSLLRATVVYRTRWLEMTELEFYSWWPMKLILILFVINMIWATVRRIEFKFVNIGVLTVHTGIVVAAVGSIMYGQFKLEGDTILFRRDLGGVPERVFYDATEPAIYIAAGSAEMMLPLPELPRYNDYELGELDIRLHDRPAFRDRFGPHVRMTIPGFLAYANLVPMWKPIDQLSDPADAQMVSPLIELSIAGDAEADGSRMALAAAVPADRVSDNPGWAVEYLASPTQQRVEDLLTHVDGMHGLIVAIPEINFRKAYTIEPGQTIELDDTGYSLAVREIGDYGMPFATEGYKGATDTRALVHFQGNGKNFTRIVMHRYPERSQDFIPVPDDPTVGPMGQRVDPDPAIHLTYLDNSKAQYHLVADAPGAKGTHFIVRLAGTRPMWAKLPEDKFPIPGPSGLQWVHVTRQIAQAARVNEPVAVPRISRNPKDEGTHIESLMPLQIEVDLPESEGGGTWQKLVWLTHMRYPKYPDQVHRPVDVNVPGVGNLHIVYSRQRYALPFAIALQEFEMQPYPGSEIPRDFVATLEIQDLTDPEAQPEVVKAHLNNPMVYRPANAPIGLNKIKISQTGWDPPDPQDPMRNTRDDNGRFTRQQRYTVLGIGNNVGIRIIFIGFTLVVVGIPWAFYVKPWLMQRKKRKIQQELAAQQTQANQPSATPTESAEESAAMAR